MAKRWTEQEDNILQVTYPDHTIKEIAHLLQRTENATRQRLSLLKLLTGHWTEEEDEQLKILHKWGCTHKEMSEYIGRSVRGVGHRLRKLGLTETRGVKYIQENWGNSK